MNAGKVLVGTSTVRSAGLTDLFVIKNLFGICTGKSANVSALTVKRILGGICTVASVNTGILTRIAAFIGTSFARSVNTGLLYLENQLTGDCVVRANHSDNFVVGERGICTVQTDNTGELSVINPMESVGVSTTDSFGTLFEANAVTGTCTVYVSMLGLLDPPSNWYVRTAATGLANGTGWNNAWSMANLNSNWGSVLAGDTVWISGGTYTTALNVGSSGTSTLPVTIKRVTAADPVVGSSATGWLSSFDTVAILNGGATCSNSNWVVFDGRAPYGFKTTVPSNGFSAIVLGANGVTNGNITVKYWEMIGPYGNRNTLFAETQGIQMAPAGNDPSTLSNITISHCLMRGFSTCIKHFANNTILEYCIIGDIQTPDGLAANPTHPDLVFNYNCPNFICRYNQFYNSDTDGFFFVYGPMANFIFTGNVIYNTHHQQLFFSNNNGTDNYGPCRIYNNVFHAPSAADFGYCSFVPKTDGTVGPTQSLIYNNVFWNVQNSLDLGTNISDFNCYITGAPLGGFPVPTPAQEPNSFTLATSPFPPFTVNTNFPNAADGNFRPLTGSIATLRRGKTLPTDGFSNFDADGNARGNSGNWLIGMYDNPASGGPVKQLFGTAQARANNRGTLTAGRKLIGTCTARGNSLATLRATKKPVGTCTARANNRGTISTPFINHLAGSCQGKMVGSGALKTSSGASWNDTDATWDSLSVTWNDVFAMTALTGTATVRANSSGTLTNTVVTKQLAGIAQARAAHTGTLRISRLFGICTVRNGNLNDPLTVTRLLIGTCTVRGVNTGNIRSFRVLAGPCEVDAAHTGILKATKRLAGSCTASNGNVNDPLIVTKSVNGLCTVRGINTGTIKATKAFSGTCTVRGTSFGDVDIPSKIIGVCTVRAVNSGSMRVVRPLTGTDTVRASNTGALRSFRVLAGLCTVSANHSDDFTVTKRLTGPSTASALNTGTITVTKRVFGICTVRALNTGVLAATKRFTGTCTVTAQNCRVTESIQVCWYLHRSISLMTG